MSWAYTVFLLGSARMNVPKFELASSENIWLQRLSGPLVSVATLIAAVLSPPLLKIADIRTNLNVCR
jgi:hypothetical protein